MKAFSILYFVLLGGGLLGAEPFSMLLWPEGVPGTTTPLSEATLKLRASYGTHPGRLTDITTPEMTVYRPENPNGAAVVVAPGGGFMFLSSVSEGTQVCEWLNGLGVTAVLLKYRTPTRDEAQPFEKPTADALRAIGLVRHHAQEWGVDPGRVGLLGFSAGGNLLGHAACDRGERSYPVRAEFDDKKGPDFGVFVYGGGFLDKEDSSKFRPGFSVPADAPPMFFVVAHDDKNNPMEAARLYLEYKKLGVPAELHVFTHGGHGFGMKAGEKPIYQWPQRCGEWMRSMGFLRAR
ncbi:MAG: Acetyl esterase/lipase [Verrucomicrobia bacterium]|nr:MAG: Acetyl esterase/lipase [Verrucomicrobiota bacterium]